MSTPLNEACDAAGRGVVAFRQRERRILLAFLAASVVLHAVVVAGIPALKQLDRPPPPLVLEVIMVKPEPLPAADTQVSRPATPLQKPQPSVATVAPREKDRPSSMAAPGSRGERLEQPPTPIPAPLAPFDSRSISAPAAVAPAASATDQRGPVAARSEPLPAQADAATMTPPAFNVAYLRNPAPQYPLIARRNGEQGTVTLRVLVTREGLPASVHVEKTSGSGHLDRAALDAVRTWRFTPARRGSEAIEASVLVPIVFRLEGSS